MGLTPGEERQGMPLASLTTWDIGGPAARIYCPRGVNDLLEYWKRHELVAPVFLGLGSNVLIPDEGLSETVILTHKGLPGVALREDGHIVVEAGVPCAKLARFCAAAGYPDGAFFAGIPGTLGGALSMNAGAWGGETWPHVVNVRGVNEAGHLVKLKQTDFLFGYRRVALRDPNARIYFLEATLCFERRLEADTMARIKDLLKKRADTQPIGTRNCGSVFRNPESDYAARLIEDVGMKGYGRGQVSVSSKHANFIINQGGGMAKDVLLLMLEIRDKVYKKHGLVLEPEVRLLGALNDIWQNTPLPR